MNESDERLILQAEMTLQKLLIFILNHYDPDIKDEQLVKDAQLVIQKLRERLYS